MRSIVGGYWSNGASCGSRYLNNNTVGTLNSNYGARAASDMWAGIYKASSQPTAGHTGHARRAKYKTGVWRQLVAGWRTLSPDIMKRHGNLYDKIISKENLKEAHRIARKGKTKKASVRWVDENLDKCIDELHDSLARGEYRTSNYVTKTVFEPKERLIYIVPYYPDRILQHAVMNVLEPIWDKLFTYHSYACRKGKGQHKGSSECMRHVRRYKYCLKCDCSKFYYSVNHRRIKEIIRKKIKCDRTLRLIDEIIDSVNRMNYFFLLCMVVFMRRWELEMWFIVEAALTVAGQCEHNVPIGNFLSQWCGNLYLNELDTMIKHKFKVKAYLRYCDDFLLFSDDKDFLNRMKHEVKNFLLDDLHLKMSKIELFPVTRGVDFLGYRHFPNGYILARKSTAKRMKKHTKGIMHNLKHGDITKETAVSMISSAQGWLKWANTHNLQQSMKLSTLKEEVLAYEEIQ